MGIMKGNLDRGPLTNRKIMAGGLMSGAAVVANPWVTPMPVPASNYLYDMLFAAKQYYGLPSQDPAVWSSGSKQYTSNNNNDGRGFRQQINLVTPSFLEQADGSLVKFNTSLMTRCLINDPANGGVANNFGLVVEATTTIWYALWNRDFTNAAWVKVGCTAAKTGTGRDSIANQCSIITLTATTATITQTLGTTVTGNRDGYLEAKQITGTPTMNWSIDNGVHNPAYSFASPRFNGICRERQQAIAFAGVAPVMVITINGNIGDQVLLDFAGIVTAVGPEMSPIVITSASTQHFNDRPSAQQADTGPLYNWLHTVGTRVFYIEFAYRDNLAGLANILSLLLGLSSTDKLKWGGITSTNSCNISPARAPSVFNKAICWQTPTETGICLNGTITRGPGGNNQDVNNHWDFLTNGTGGTSPAGACRRLTALNLIPPDAVMQNWTT